MFCVLRNAYASFSLVSLCCLTSLITPDLRADCVPAPSGIVSWYPGEGTGNDITGPNSPNQVLGAPQFIPGEVARGIKFDGNDGFAILDNLTLQFGATTSFAIEAWIRVDGVPANDSVLLDKRRPGGGLGFVVGLAGMNSGTDAGRFYISVQDGLVSTQALTAAILDTNFHHLAIVTDRGNQTLNAYLDGVLQQSSASSSLGSIANTGRLFLGFQSLDVPGTSGVPFNGVIDELTIYNRALSAAEIQAIVTASAAGKCRRSIDWFKIAGGGGAASGGGRFLLGTIGQADAGGPMTNNQFSLVGGFWALSIAVQTVGAPTLTIVSSGPTQATISWAPNTPGFVLQETTSFSPAVWVNSPSGSTNPVTVPANLPAKFYRLTKP